MTVQQILDRASLLYPMPSNWTDTNKIDVLNMEIQEIYKELSIKGSSYIITHDDIAIYALPTGVLKENITWIGYTTDTALDGETQFTEYRYLKPDHRLSGNVWYDALGGNIAIYPVPTADHGILGIIYNKKPTALVSTAMTAIPELREEWHRILVYALIIEVAGSGNKPDAAMVNVYTQKYNMLMQEIMQSRYDRETSYPSTKDVMKKSSRALVSDRHYVVTTDLLLSYDPDTINEVVARNIAISQTYTGSITRAEMITGKTLVAGVTSYTIRVQSISLVVTGAFNSGSGTSFIIQDSNTTPAVILTCLKAALTNGASITTGTITVGVTEGAGLSGSLTASKGIVVAADAAWTVGTSIAITINYTLTYNG